MIYSSIRYRRDLVKALSGTALASAAFWASPVLAQAAPAAAAEAQEPVSSAEQEAAASDIIVTGSRIVRDGSTAPTPVTVVSAQQLQATSPGAIPAALNQLPQFSGSRNNATVSGNGNSPSGGNYLNLRNLGSIRTLMLLDGQRLPPTDYTGAVDANIIPQALVARVDVVTGGASAAYGSDAVTGVVNFVLDTKFNGLKGQAQRGVSKYGDGESYKINVAGGFNLFGSDRVHVLFSYDHYQIDGITDSLALRHGGRPYGALDITRVGTGTATNPYIDVANARYATATYGTLVSYTGTVNAGNPLRGMQFGPGGILLPFNPGQTTGTSGYNIGGDGVISFGKSLTGEQNTDQGFGRIDVEIADGITAFVQGTYANSFNSLVTIGSGTQIGDFQIFAENPFLPTNARTMLTNAGFNSFVAGRIEADQPPKLARFTNDVVTIMSGIKGKLAGFDWKLGYSHGDSVMNAAHEGNFDNARWLAALDAVRGPTGNIVCRITITNPGLQDNCVPINIFGNGSPSKAAYDYVSQVSRYRVQQKMDIWSADVSGNLFDLPAGAVAAAVGIEYRKQSLLQTSNSDPTKSISLVGLRTNVPPFILQYNSTNVGFAQGKQDVKEAYGEIVVPVFKNSSLGYNLELNGAARYTDYSTSGSVATWKLGVSYAPFEQLRFRATRSRDIRAPTLFELYAGPTAARSQFNDRLTGQNNNLINYTQGNPNLTPEIGNTLTVGGVWQPSFVRGLSFSVDYYKVKITDAIGTLSLDTIQDQCAASNGTADVCSSIVRPFPYSNNTPANFPTATFQVPFNQASVKVSGIDYEASMRFDLGRLVFGEGSLNLRLIGTHLIDYLTQSQTGGRIIQSNNTAGTSNNVKDRVNLQVGYRDGPLSIDGQLRYFGPAKRTQDPTVFYANPDIKSVTYTDLTVQYRFSAGGVEFEPYLTVNNLFNVTAPIFSPACQPGQCYPTNTAVYDVVGRYITTGIRAKF
jgi:iron complex outermembrane receptor protein